MFWYVCVARARPGIELFYIHATEKKPRDAPFQIGSKKEPLDAGRHLFTSHVISELYNLPITSYYPPLKFFLMTIILTPRR